MNVGIIGFGYTGKQHARAFRKMRGVSIGGVVETDPQRRSEIEAKSHEDYHSLLADPSIEAVSVCLPHALHEEVATAALEAGKHVLVEKPLAMSLEAGERLCRLADRVSRVLMVEMTHRFLPPMVEARELIRKGEIGEVIAVDDVLFENIGLFGSLPQWIFQRSQSGGGVGLTSGVHLIDHVAWLTDQRLTLASARFGYSQGFGNVEDTAAFFLHLNSGAPVHILLSWRSAGAGLEALVCIYGTKGTLRIRPWHGWELELTDETKRQIHFPDQLTIPERALQGMMGALSEFISAARQGRKPQPAPEEALLSQAIIEQAYQENRSQPHGRCERTLSLPAQRNSGERAG